MSECGGAIMSLWGNAGTLSRYLDPESGEEFGDYLRDNPLAVSIILYEVAFYIMLRCLLS